jgi:hypothetical protein
VTAGRVLDQASRDERVHGADELGARVRQGQQLAEGRVAAAELERRALGRRGVHLLVVEGPGRHPAQAPLRVAERALQPLRVGKLPHSEQQQPVGVDVERLVGRQRPVHRLAPQRAARPAQHREHDPLDLGGERAGQLERRQDVRLDEHLAERRARGLDRAHRLPELRLGDAARAEQAGAQPVLLDGRRGEHDRAVQEVEALRDLALLERQHARPALVAHAADLVGHEHPRQVVDLTALHVRSSAALPPRDSAQLQPGTT